MTLFTHKDQQELIQGLELFEQYKEEGETWTRVPNGLIRTTYNFETFMPVGSAFFDDSADFNFQHYEPQEGIKDILRDLLDEFKK